MLRSGARGYKSLGLEFMASKVQDRIIKQDNNYIHYIQTRTFIHLYTNIDFGYRDIDVRSEDIISCFFPWLYQPGVTLSTKKSDLQPWLSPRNHLFPRHRQPPVAVASGAWGWEPLNPPYGSAGATLSTASCQRSPVDPAVVNVPQQTGTSTFLLGESTIWKWPLSIAMLNY